LIEEIIEEFSSWALFAILLLNCINQLIKKLNNEIIAHSTN
jgi:hypothetical protein